MNEYIRLVSLMDYIYSRLMANLNRLTNEQLERLLHRCRAELMFRDAVLFDEPVCDYSVLNSPVWIASEWEIERLHDARRMI